MRVLRKLQPGEEVYIEMVPGLHLSLVQMGRTQEYHVPLRQRITRKSPSFASFFGKILTNAGSILRVMPTQLKGTQRQSRETGTHTAEVPYNAIKKILVFTGQTNEDTVRKGRVIVAGSSFSSRRGFGWDNRKNTELPMEQPHMKPAERLFEEVLIG